MIVEYDEDLQPTGTGSMQPRVSKKDMLKICNGLNVMLKNANAKAKGSTANILLCTDTKQKTSESKLPEALKSLTKIAVERPSVPKTSQPKKAPTQSDQPVAGQRTNNPRPSGSIPEENIRKCVRKAPSFTKLINESLAELNSPPPSPDPPRMYTENQVQEMILEAQKKNTSDNFTTSTPTRDPSPIPKKKPSRQLAAEFPTRVSPRVIAQSTPSVNHNTSGLDRIQNAVSTKKKSLFQNKASTSKPVVDDNESLLSIPPLSPMTTSVKENAYRQELDNMHKEMLKGNTDAIAEAHSVMNKKIIESQMKMAETITSVADSVTSAFKQQTLKLVECESSCVDRFEDGCDAMNTVQEKLVERVLSKEIKMVQGLENIGKAVMKTADLIAKSQEVMVKGLGDMSSGMNTLSQNMARLVVVSENLSRSNEETARSQKNANSAIEVLVANLNLLSASQERINQAHVARSLLECK